MTLQRRVMIAASYVLVAGGFVYVATTRSSATLSPGVRPVAVIGPDLSPPNRKCVWDFKRDTVPHTAYFVSHGPWYDAETLGDPTRRGPPIFYRVEIYPYICGTGLKMMGCSTPPILFRWDFRIEELPAGFLTKPIDEILNFDEASGVVTLHIGDRHITHKLQ